MSEIERKEGQKDIEFLYEIGCLRFIPRMWQHVTGLNFANLAEHTLRVTWIAATIAKYEKVNIDKVVKMALVHDVGESRTGDAHYVAKMYSERNEEKAIEDIFKDTGFAEEFINLWKEYEKRESIESKIVKDADKLDVEFELQEQAAKGSKLKDEWQEERKEFVYPTLYTETGKRIWEGVSSSNPNDWYLRELQRLRKGNYGR